MISVVWRAPDGRALSVLVSFDRKRVRSRACNFIVLYPDVHRLLFVCNDEKKIRAHNWILIISNIQLDFKSCAHTMSMQTPPLDKTNQLNSTQHHTIISNIKRQHNRIVQEEGTTLHRSNNPTGMHPPGPHLGQQQQQQQQHHTPTSSTGSNAHNPHPLYHTHKSQPHDRHNRYRHRSYITWRQGRTCV